MKPHSSWRISRVHVLLGVTIVIALLMVRGTNAGNEPIHLTTDWSHRHLVFSAPKGLMQQFQLSGNPRYVQQWIRRNAEYRGRIRWPRNPDLLQRDWSMDMGPGATVGAGKYPAKFSFDVSTAKCGTDPNPDFVVYNTSLAGSGTSATASATGAFTTLPSPELGLSESPTARTA